MVKIDNGDLTKKMKEVKRFRRMIMGNRRIGRGDKGED
jgi:hypothetical protein